MAVLRRLSLKPHARNASTSQPTEHTPVEPSTMSTPTTAAPSRADTMATTASETAVPDVDPNSTAGLLHDRLTAWRSVVSNLEDYVKAIEKIHKSQAKEYEHALKTISGPLKNADNFDQNLGGVAGFFENMRSNTQALVNTNAETEKSIKGQVLPVLERLAKEIKAKGKELAHGAEKSAKAVAKARNTTQKSIETLGSQTAAFESSGGKLHSSDDPYVVRRGVLHHLHKQVVEENNYHNDLVAVQANFATFEAHILQVVTQAFENFTQLAAGQGEKTRALHSDMLSTVQKIPGDFEWNHFTQRSGDRLVNPAEPPRAVEAITFPNIDHASTKALIEGSLERKSRNKLSWGYATAYYVITPAKFLHEFKDSDDARHEPKPELSIYLPDAMIGAVNLDKFHVKGKDVSKGLGGKLSGSSELSFKAHTAADADQWCAILRECVGAQAPADVSPVVTPTVTSPTHTWGDEKTAAEGTAAVPAAAAVAGESSHATAVPATTATTAAPAAAPVVTTTGTHAAQESGIESVPASATSATAPTTLPAATTATTPAATTTAPTTVPAAGAHTELPIVSESKGAAA